MRVFTDRYGAGVELAQRLEPVLEPDVDGGGVVVLGMPRGGMPVAFEVAERLEASLDVLPMRHLGVPARPGLHYGTIGEGGVRLVDDAVVRECHLGDHEMAEIEAKQLAALRRQARRMRGGHARVPLAGRVAVIVDDGTSLDATAQAACRIARAQGARRVVVAAPTGPVDVEKILTGYADQVVGGRDHVVLKLNRQAQAAMPGTCQLAVVPGATHLFEEAGTLDEVADLARDWFVEHLGRPVGVCQPAEMTAQSGRSSS